MEQTQGSISDERLATMISEIENDISKWPDQFKSQAWEIFGDDLSALRELRQARRDLATYRNAPCPFEQENEALPASDEPREVIHRRVNLYIGDNNAIPLLHVFDLKLRKLDGDGKAWGIDAEEELTALRASHKRLVDALEELVSFAAYSGDMRGAANEHGRAALAEARKLEGK